MSTTKKLVHKIGRTSYYTSHGGMVHSTRRLLYQQAAHFVCNVAHNFDFKQNDFYENSLIEVEKPIVVRDEWSSVDYDYVKTIDRNKPPVSVTKTYNRKFYFYVKTPQLFKEVGMNNTNFLQCEGFFNTTKTKLLKDCQIAFGNSNEHLQHFCDYEKQTHKSSKRQTGGVDTQIWDEWVYKDKGGKLLKLLNAVVRGTRVFWQQTHQNAKGHLPKKLEKGFF